MWMRRNATVTSSVPDADRLSAIISPELYLPVPKKRREENETPAIVSGLELIEIVALFRPPRLPRRRRTF